MMGIISQMTCNTITDMRSMWKDGPNLLLLHLYLVIVNFQTLKLFPFGCWRILQTLVFLFNLSLHTRNSRRCQKLGFIFCIILKRWISIFIGKVLKGPSVSDNNHHTLLQTLPFRFIHSSSQSILNVLPHNASPTLLMTKFLFLKDQLKECDILNMLFFFY
jgi:hypothetical protein